MNLYYIDDINKTVNFSFSYDKELKEKFKNSDRNARYNGDSKEWIIPINEFTKAFLVNVVKQHDFKKKAIETKEVAFTYKKSAVDYTYLKGLCDAKGFTYTPRDYQLEALAYGREKGSFINGDAPGTGKCEYVENRVFTPNGRCRIGDLTIGDYVIGKNGLKTKVTAIHPQKEKKALYRVTLNDGFSALFTEGHLFTVTSSKKGFLNKSPKIHTISLKDMMDKSLCIDTFGTGHNSKKKHITETYYKPNGKNKWKIPVCEPIVYENKVDFKIDPYLFGFIIGDGHITKSGNVFMEFHKDDFESVLHGYDFDEIKSKNNCRKASIKQFKGELKRLKLNGKLSYDKFIPEDYKYSNVKDRLSLLRGLMDSDGYVSDSKSNGFNGCTFSTSSRMLIKDVAEIVHSLGGVVRLNKPQYKTYNLRGNKVRSKNLNYSCSIKLPRGMFPFKLKRKLDRYRDPIKYDVNRIISDISFECYGDSVCISVEAEDCLYVTEHGIVTHNTFQSIMYAETSNSFPCLVITPSSVKYNWQEKWREITGNKRTVSVIEASPTKKCPNDWTSDVTVLNYDILGKKSGKNTLLKFEELKTTPWKMLICDEAHFLKEKTSQRAKAIKKIIGKKDIIVQLLTGTAIMSKPVEIWNLLKLIKKDHLIAKDWFQFIKRFCGGYMGGFGWVTNGATNMFEFNRLLRENCYIRREISEVLKELPESIQEIIQIPITNIRKITFAEKDFLKYIEQERGIEAMESASEAEHLVSLSEFRKLAIQGKIKGIEQYLNDWKAVSNEKVLIFGIHEEGLSYLANKYKSLLINGKASAKRKQEIVNEWKNNDDMFLFANGDAAGTGVDGLQNVCSNMVIVELPWRTSDLSQWIARLHRSGQKSVVNVKFLLNFKTIDLQMWNMLALKERVTESVNKGKDVLKNGGGMKAVLKEILKKVK